MGCAGPTQWVTDTQPFSRKSSQALKEPRGSLGFPWTTGKSVSQAGESTGWDITAYFGPGLGEDTFNAGHENAFGRRLCEPLEASRWQRGKWGDATDATVREVSKDTFRRLAPPAPRGALSVCSQGLAHDINWDSFLLHLTCSQNPRAGPLRRDPRWAYLHNAVERSLFPLC